MNKGLCLVLGGAGFIGSHVVEALLESSYPVRVFDLPRQRMNGITHLLDRIQLAEGDFTNEADLAHAMLGVDYVFHLVGTTLPQTSNENPIYDAESNVIGTLRLLQVAHTACVKKVIFISSGGTVYGIPQQIPIPETHSTLPICAYGISKLAIEKYLHLFYHLYGLDYVVLRVSNAFGERQRSVEARQGVIAVFMDCLRRGEPITIWGNGAVVRDFIYVKDVARAFVLAVASTSAPHVFNVGSGIGTSLNELLVLLERVTGITPRVVYMPGRAVDVPVNVLDTARVQAKWGWSPTTPLEAGLAQLWEWVSRQES